MSQRKCTVAVAAISACASVVVYEILRRLASWATGDEQEEKTTDVCESDALPELGKSLRDREYSLVENLHPLNNGSYGGVPQRVLKAQKRMMDERESNPEMWCRFRRQDMYKDAVKNVAEFVCAKPENLVLVENVTTATNSIVKSFKFSAGDQILVTNHTYGAVLKTLKFVTNLNQDVSTVSVEIPIQTTAKEIIDLHTRALDENPRIKIAMLDHIASFSALLLPIKELIEICHSRGVIVAIDGAHAPGQLPLRLEELGADFYYGNLHKWLYSPRGCALFYVHPKHQSWIRTAISSHHTFDQDLQDRFHYIGTRDAIPYFTAKHAIHYHYYLGGLERITAYNSLLVQWAAEMLAKAWNTTWVDRDEELRAPFMRLVLLPPSPKLALYEANKDLIYEILKKHSVAVAVSNDGEDRFVRISAQVYNYKEEYYFLRDAVIDVLDIKN
ncbi:putative L-cysteine desulfhydrase 1 [Strongylocentrotus purpuratus]|uniref:Aminotransferase class V domain-containing protein n=1 Tax=Strongylocentrotus purpuratus TaxID=7668 RepID=A0A7M7PN55_STRPU|nr:putative L-cysteine desulfhydrase 1 [Strongylocentrotus purpuratus]|eukprot:XP_003729578.1 PREDICTED: putative L-cysteine desulfhydrase 1 [Strongylocentrotus purpuratus]